MAGRPTIVVVYNMRLYHSVKTEKSASAKVGDDRWLRPKPLGKRYGRRGYRRSTDRGKR